MGHHVKAAGALAGTLSLVTGLTLLQAPPAHADDNYCNDVVGTSVEETLSSHGAAAALDQMGDEFYTRRLEDLPAHYLTCPLVTEAINAGAEQVVMRVSPSPWWRAFWRW